MKQKIISLLLVVALMLSTLPGNILAQSSCDHNYEITAHNPVGCNTYEDWEYTCTKCGHSFTVSGEEPLGHQFLYSDICRVCQAPKEFTIHLYDNARDGWQGIELMVYTNGTFRETLTLSSGFHKEFTIPYESGKTYQFYWRYPANASNRTGECEFEIVLGETRLLYSSASENFSNNQQILEVCGHNYVNRICTMCGERQYADQIKWQLTADASVSDVAVDLRLITFVDSLEDFSRVTFTISFTDASGKVRTANWNCTNAYKYIRSNGYYVYADDLFGNGAKYLLTFVITDWPQAYFNTDITVTVNRYDTTGKLHSTATRIFAISDAL